MQVESSYGCVLRSFGYRPFCFAFIVLHVSPESIISRNVRRQGPVFVRFLRKVDGVKGFVYVVRAVDNRVTDDHVLVTQDRVFLFVVFTARSLFATAVLVLEFYVLVIPACPRLTGHYAGVEDLIAFDDGIYLLDELAVGLGQDDLLVSAGAEDLGFVAGRVFYQDDFRTGGILLSDSQVVLQSLYPNGLTRFVAFLRGTHAFRAFDRTVLGVQTDGKGREP